MTAKWYRRGRHLFPLAFGVVSVIALGTYLISLSAGAEGVNAQEYGAAKTPIVNGHLQRVERDYVLFAGDSHMELYNASGTMCGRAIVNAAIGGLGVRTYMEFLKGLQFPRKPSAVALTVGTNDLFRKKSPTSEASRARWETDARALVSRLREISPVVVVNALPPFGETLLKTLDDDAVKVYSETLKGVCSTIAGCVYRDPFAAIRSDRFGVAVKGAMSDELHVRDYRKSYAALDADICR